MTSWRKSVPDSLVEKMGGDEHDVDRLYEELVGEYELIRAVVKFTESGEIFDLKPPDISGFHDDYLESKRSGKKSKRWAMKSLPRARLNCSLPTELWRCGREPSLSP